MNKKDKTEHTYHIAKNIAKTLILFRVWKGFTQSQIADSIGVTFQQVQKYEKGTNGLSLQKFCKFCNLFNVDPNTFLKAFDSGILILTNQVKDVKVTEVSLEEITKDPTMRLDAKYWINKKEEDEKEKD